MFDIEECWCSIEMEILVYDSVAWQRKKKKKKKIVIMFQNRKFFYKWNLDLNSSHHVFILHLKSIAIKLGHKFEKQENERNKMKKYFRKNKNQQIKTQIN